MVSLVNVNSKSSIITITSFGADVFEELKTLIYKNNIIYKKIHVVFPGSYCDSSNMMNIINLLKTSYRKLIIHIPYYNDSTIEDILEDKGIKVIKNDAVFKFYDTCHTYTIHPEYCNIYRSTYTNTPRKIYTQYYSFVYEQIITVPKII